MVGPLALLVLNHSSRATTWTTSSVLRTRVCAMHMPAAESTQGSNARLRVPDCSGLESTFPDY